MSFDRAIIVMGVSGCGKSSVGDAIGKMLGFPFIEGDQLHPAANVEKMAAGIPLDDEDRWPWLDLIGKKLAEARQARSGIIISCSALKRVYRDRLRQADDRLCFVYLEGSKALLTKRMAARTGHYMPVSLLESQLATLEPPTGEPGVVTIDIDRSIQEIADKAVEELRALD